MLLRPSQQFINGLLHLAWSFSFKDLGQPGIINELVFLCEKGQLQVVDEYDDEGQRSKVRSLSYPSMDQLPSSEDVSNLEELLLITQEEVNPTDEDV